MLLEHLNGSSIRSPSRPECSYPSLAICWEHNYKPLVPRNPQASSVSEQRADSVPVFLGPLALNLASKHLQRCRIRNSHTPHGSVSWRHVLKPRHQKGTCPLTFCLWHSCSEAKSPDQPDVERLHFLPPSVTRLLVSASCCPPAHPQMRADLVFSDSRAPWAECLLERAPDLPSQSAGRGWTWLILN